MLEASGLTLRNLVRKWLPVAFTQLHPELITSTMPPALQGLRVEWGEKGGLLQREGREGGGGQEGSQLTLQSRSEEVSSV